MPSVAPSDFPSQTPSYSDAFFDRAGFRTILLVSQREQFNESEEVLISTLYESYTENFAPEAVRTKTVCEIENQDVVDCFVGNSFCTDWGVNVSDPNSQEGYTNYVDFFCNYTSPITNVTSYADRLARFADFNGDLISSQMQALDLPVIRAGAAAIRSPPPTASPTEAPVAAPSISPAPTPRGPTAMPSFANPTETEMPTFSAATEVPTHLPTNPGATNGPTSSPTDTVESSSGGSANGVIVGVVVSLGIIVLVGLFCWYQMTITRRRAAFMHTRAQ